MNTHNDRVTGTPNKEALDQFIESFVNFLLREKLHENEGEGEEKIPSPQNKG